MLARVLLVSGLVLGLWASAANAAADPYSTSIGLTGAKAGVATELTFSFRGTGRNVEKVETIEIGLAPGTTVNADAFQRTCTLDDHGPFSGAICAQKFRDARIGEGTMTVEMLGMHTVTADAYRVDGAPEGANLVFFFAEGQVFGVGAQSIFGSISLDAEAPPRLRIHGIQAQLHLPFGATAELEKGSFTFAGEPGKSAFTNPIEGSAADWMYETKLTWADGGQSQRVHATPSE